MKVSSISLSYRNGFSDVDSNGIAMYMLAIAGDNGEPIHKHSSYYYVSDSIQKYVVCVKKVNICIRLPIGILVCSFRDESEASLSHH